MKNSPGDKPLFIYFAGHGVDGHLVPYLNKDNVSLNNGMSEEQENKLIINAGISPQELFEAIGNKKTVLIVDKCFAGKLAKDSPKNITVITSTDEKSEAAENTFSRRSVRFEKGKEEIMIPKGISVVGDGNSSLEHRGVFTAGLTSGKDGFNLKQGINLANNLIKKQNPNISNDGINIQTKK